MVCRGRFAAGPGTARGLSRSQFVAVSVNELETAVTRLTKEIRCEAGRIFEFCPFEPFADLARARLQGQVSFAKANPARLL